MKMTRILVTGNEGFIGSYLTEELNNWEGFDLKSSKDIVVDDFPDADIVIHLAAQTSVLESVENPIEDMITNILGTIRIARRYPNAKIIFASSGGAIQEKIESPYGLSKFCAEEYLKLLHNNTVILRFPNIYGKGSKSVVDKFIEGDVNIYGDGSATRDYVYVKDLVEAIKESIDWPQGTYSLGSGQNTSVLDLAQATNKPVNFTPRKAGELQDSYVSNTSPSWQAKTKVLDYIKGSL